MRSLLFCVPFIVALAACGRESEHDRYAHALEKKLEWVETANAARTFETDTSGGKSRFLSVCGATCMIPGVNSLNAERCYPKVSVERIRGTGDVFLSNRQEQLQARAFAFARDYNLLVASSERAKGKSTCKSEEDWDEGFWAISKAVQSLTATNDASSESLVTISKNSATFEIVLPRDIPIDPFKDQVCAVMAEHGLSRAANVRYRIDGNAKNAWHEIVCRGGRAAS